MKAVAPRTDEAIIIRWWKNEDVPLICQWIDDAQVRRAIGVSEGADQSSIETAMWLALGDEQQRWMVAEQGGEVIGFFGITNINPDGSAAFHIVMSPDHQGRGGFVSRKARRILKAMGLRKLIVMIDKDNTRAKRLAQLHGAEFPDYDIGYVDLQERI